MKIMCIFFIIWGFLATLLSWDLFEFVFIGTGTIIVFTTPILFIFLNFYQFNKNIKLTIDRQKEIIIVNDSEAINFDDLKVVSYKNIYFEPTNGWWNSKKESHWSSFSYFKIITKNNTEYSISSLIMDVEKLPIKPSKTEYRLMPWIARSKKG